MTRKKRLLIGPAVPDRTTLESLVVRLGHYLSHVQVDSIVIAVTPELAATHLVRGLSSPVLPPGFDQEALTRVRAVAPSISTRVVDSASTDLVADFLLFWDIRGRETEPWRTLATKYRQNRTKFDIDWTNTRTDGIWFAELALILSRDSRGFDQGEHERFCRATEHLRGSARAYLVATGPSARRALDVDMSDGVRIVCNTAILDDAVMNHVAPQIVTFADPIFHFGPSTYAHRYYRALGRAAVRHDFTIVTLERFAPLLRDRLPHLAERVVGVRQGLAGWPQNYDLTRSLAVRPYPNILTMLMLPLAATFSNSIRLFGFDGRDPHESYFWKHGTTVQFDRELGEIRLVHPGFFELDYDDYYDQHVASVERMFTDLELRGGEITPGSSSFMAPLRRRSGDGVAVARPEPARPLIVSITPDWTGNFGHFGPWERSMASTARGLGFEYTSLASRALDPTEDAVVPTFSHGTLGQHSADPKQFEAELRLGLERVAGGHPAISCFYAADVWQLAGVLAVAADRPTTTFAVNLMRSHDTVMSLGTDRPNVPAQLLAECLDIAHGTNVHVCLDTDAIAHDLAASTGRRVPTWPMITLSDASFLWEQGRIAPADGPIRLVAPVHAQVSKGFAEVASVAERFSDLDGHRHVSLTARFVHQPATGTPAEYLVLADRFLEAGGELVFDNLSDAQFAALVGGAHAVLLPYRLGTFRTRTSGVLLDAIAAGKPVVAVRGTWAGDIVEREEIGITYADQDVESLESAIRAMVRRLPELTDSAEAKRDRLIAQFRPERLVTFMAEMAAARNPPPDQLRVAGLRRLVDIAVAAHFLSDVARDDRRLVDLVELDNERRLREDALDKVEELRTMLAWNQHEVRRLQAKAASAERQQT